MSNTFIVVGENGFDLDVVADTLRNEISALPPDQPQLAKTKLGEQDGVSEFLVVVRGHENPHTHPDADLIFVVLQGGGWLQRSPAAPDPGTNIQVPVGGTVVVPKGVCHAFHNTWDSDSVLLATFSPATPASGECMSTGSDSPGTQTAPETGGRPHDVRPRSA